MSSLTTALSSSTGLQAAVLNIANYHTCRRDDYHSGYAFGAAPGNGAGDGTGDDTGDDTGGDAGVDAGGNAGGDEVGDEGEIPFEASGFSDYFTAYYEGRLEPSYLCPPRLDPIDWTVAAVYVPTGRTPYLHGSLLRCLLYCTRQHI